MAQKLTRSFVVIIGLVALMSLSLPASAQIKIGGVVPLSPPGAVDGGRSMQQGMQMAADEVNAAGGLLGQKMELLIGDTSGIPEKGVAVMERFITGDKVVAVTGEFHSSVGLAEMEVAHRYGIPFVLSETWADDITARQYPEVFRIAPANSLVYDSPVGWIKQAGFKNVGAIFENTDWGLGAIKIFEEKLKAVGVKMTGVHAELTVTDFTPQLLQFKNMSPRPDLFINGVSGTGGYLLTKQVYDLGLAPTGQTAVICLSTDMTLPDFWPSVGKAGVYAIINPPGLPGIPKTQTFNRFAAAFKAKYNREPDIAAMEGYDGVMLLAEAIKNAKSVEPAKMEAVLRTIKWEGPRGTIWFSQDKSPAWMYQTWPDVPILIAQYTKESQIATDATILWPRRLATTDKLILRP
jgi:branched-chain amino acid transport system substrate-binding protein